MSETSELRADCANCFGLCCVALAFSRSTDFAIDKAVGDPCPNLQQDFRCGIHDKLRPTGFQGCTVYDCFGAGQKISQVTFVGRNWRESPDGARQMFAALPVMRQFHELLWYLSEALARPAARPVHRQVQAQLEKIERLTLSDVDTLLNLDVAAHRAEVNTLLLRTSELVRAEVRGKKKDRRGADLFGARLKGADLHGADLRGAYLIAADLSGADLRLADVIGADFRDTNLAGADLTDCLFLTQTQVNAAQGDAATLLPDGLDRPSHWSKDAPAPAARKEAARGDAPRKGSQGRKPSTPGRKRSSGSRNK
ncbi:pentapeptide repeat-containing protein [Streptomyces sp. CBMA152]|uniref:pentapeptide repeat-containing protein n=1 Tax=Streptomyces sp. CBMA152 TaxID=1896312 RepID=UPI001CB73453|nr:pentapeptide repeat-containing protein [Streptomyces sp. CBMA152]